MSDTIRLLIYLPYQRQKTLIQVPATCTATQVMEKLSEMYGQKKTGPQAHFLYFPEMEMMLEKEKTLQDQNVSHGAILYWI